MDAPPPITSSPDATLTTRGESVAVAESATGGLVPAALLAVPGASPISLAAG
jgi:nicotinamide mononucleotide (NMN) deamidase PncC